MSRCHLILVTILLLLGAHVSTAETPDPIRLVCFGDSLTGHRPGEQYRGQYLKYADLLGLMLEARVGTGRIAVVNSGWAGDMTIPKRNEGWPGARARVDDDIVAHDPDLVTMLIGGNNRADTPEKAAQLEEDLEAMVAAVRTTDARLLLLCYPPALPGEGERGWPLAEYANPVIRKVAERHAIPLLDLGPAMITAAEEHGRALLVNQQDGVHLLSLGEMVFARTIFAEFDRRGWVAELAGQP